MGMLEFLGLRKTTTPYRLLDVRELGRRAAQSRSEEYPEAAEAYRETKYRFSKPTTPREPRELPKQPEAERTRQRKRFAKKVAPKRARLINSSDYMKFGADAQFPYAPEQPEVRVGAPSVVLEEHHHERRILRGGDAPIVWSAERHVQRDYPAHQVGARVQQTGDYAVERARVETSVRFLKARKSAGRQILGRIFGGARERSQKH